MILTSVFLQLLKQSLWVKRFRALYLSPRIQSLSLVKVWISDVSWSWHINQTWFVFCSQSELANNLLVQNAHKQRPTSGTLHPADRPHGHIKVAVVDALCVTVCTAFPYKRTHLGADVSTDVSAQRVSELGILLSACEAPSTSRTGGYAVMGIRAAKMTGSRTTVSNIDQHGSVRQPYLL